MATFVFVALILFSLFLAFASKRGHDVSDLKNYLIASRQFGSALLFFLAVGEIYSIGTMIGFPGGIYAKGPTYGVWFLGYILLAYPLGYFLNPLIWRAGQIYDAVTLPDLFKGHFRSRALELVVTLSAILFLIPWGQLQFTGLIVALGGLGWHFPPTVLVLIAAALAFAYIAISGVHASAFISVLKDITLVLAVLVVGVAAARSHGLSEIFREANQHIPGKMTGTEQTFAMTTIFFQALGFYMIPFSVPYLFTARSEQTIRRTQVLMPLYMLMYPFLVVAAYYSLAQAFQLSSPNDAFMVAALHLLPDWLLGIVAAGASLSGLIVLAGISLAIGPLVSRNVLHGLSEPQQKTGAQIVIVVYLVASIALTLASPGTLMLTLINTAYFGFGQVFPGVLAILFFRKVHPLAVLAGLVTGDVLAVLLYVWNVNTFGINIGLISLVINALIVWLGSVLVPRGASYVPVVERPALAKPQRA